MFRKHKPSNNPEPHCHFIYYYFILAMSVLVIVCGASTLSDLLCSSSSGKTHSTTPLTSVKLSGPFIQSHRNSSMEVSFILVSKYKYRTDTDMGAQPSEKTTSMTRSCTVVASSNQATYSVKWGNSNVLTSSLNTRGFGMVLSELVAFVGKLFATDQATGVLYEISTNAEPIPRHILMGGDGLNAVGMQSEWAAVKGGVLFIGTCSHRREAAWLGSGGGRALEMDRKFPGNVRTHVSGGEGTNSDIHPANEDNEGISSKPLGDVSSSVRRRLLAAGMNTPQWIVTIDPTGRVNHLDWSQEYAALESAAHIHSQVADLSTPSLRVGSGRGLSHEAVLWSDTLSLWIFLPTVVIPPLPVTLSSTATLRGQTGERSQHRAPSRRNTAATGSNLMGPSVGDVLLIHSLSDFVSIKVASIDVLDIIRSANVSLPVSLSTETAHFQFSSAKFLPHSGDKVIMAILRVQSVSLPDIAAGEVRSFLTFFGIDGTRVQPSVLIPESDTFVYSGVEFL